MAVIDVLTLGEVYLDKYRNLMLEAYRACPDAFTSTVEEREACPKSWWLKRLSSDEGLFLTIGAIDGDVLQAVVGLEFSDRAKTRHKAHLVGMYVRPEARGNGIGRKLLDHVLAAAVGTKGLKAIVLTVTEGNDAAIKLYESVGFKSFGVEPKAIYSSGKYLAKQHMRLNVGPAVNTK